MNILKSIQGFSTFDFLTLITSVTAVAAIAGPIVQRSYQAEKLAQADREMKKMAFEMAVLTASPLNTTARGPASEEQTLSSLDPWGNPYKARFLKNPYGIPTHLVIWSGGPNGRQDTSSVESSAKVGAMGVVFDGDDLGFITSAR